jgi:hypothetical protein
MEQPIAIAIAIPIPIPMPSILGYNSIFGTVPYALGAHPMTHENLGLWVWVGIAIGIAIGIGFYTAWNSRLR